MNYRVHTVQFAIPADDPAFSLTNLRDQLQETLFDQEGWSGSFQIIGTRDHDDANGECDDHFQREALDLGAIKANATDIIRYEQLVKNTAQAWGWKEGEDPWGEASGIHLVNEHFDRIRARHDWIGACEDIDVQPGEFPERFIVKGHTAEGPDARLVVDGGFAPFRIFDTSLKTCIYGEWADRTEAEAVAEKMNVHYHRTIKEGKAA
jgi:hypothetical protein